jgi:hypothetical protein
MRILPVSLLLASLALPAAAESRFGLGLDLLFEHQESLEVSAFRGTILTRDLLNGGEQSAEQPSDPALLNRKFDFVWELEGTGVELPINLPGRWGLDSKVVLQAGVADVSLDFIGLRDSRDNAALSGRGPLFGAELEVEGSPWGSSPWSLGGSVRWQKVPSLTMDRSPAFQLEGFEALGDGVQMSRQGFEVIGDDVSLSQEVEEITLRTGYRVSGNTESDLGVRHRRTEVEIEDALGYLDPLGESETRLSSHTDFASNATYVVAGIETWLSDRFHGRAETAVGEEDWMVRASIRYFWPRPTVRDGDEDSPEAQQRAIGIAKALAPGLAALEAAFLAGWRALTVVIGPDGEPAYVARELESLLARTERALVTALARYDELEALRDWVQDEFQELETELDLKRPGSVSRQVRIDSAGLPMFALSRSSLAMSVEPTVNRASADSAIAGSYQKGKGVAQGPLRMRLVFDTPLRGAVSLVIHPRYNASLTSPLRKRLEPGADLPIWIGSYSWRLERRGVAIRHCDGRIAAPTPRCPLSVTEYACMKLDCNDTRCKPEACR